MSPQDELKKAGVVVLPPVAPEQPESQIIMARLEALGYTFRLNLCTDTIEVNRHALSDILAARLRMQLRDIGLTKKLKAAEDAYIAAAEMNAYHPVHDYLNALKWDGNDHITALTDYMTSSDPPVIYRDKSEMPLHALYFYRWLIGAVAKALDGKQNPMLVIDGPQGIGKSTLAKWLCGLIGYFIEGPINPLDKDNDVRLISKWIWEVSELGATTRRADVEALKSFITKEIVTVRKSYGRYDISKPAMASFIGTVNNTTGFLADESGNRRFMITRLEKIDRKYQQLDIDQIWAQAVHLYRSGERWMLVGEEAEAQRAANERYEVDSVLDDWIDRFFIFDRDNDSTYTLADIINTMSIDGVRLSGSERSQAMELARILKRKGASKIETRQGKRWTGFYTRPR